MKCPLCQQQLVPQQLAGITVDVCSACIGIWFDPGEFGAYGQMTGSALADALKAFQVDASEPAQECPRCHTVAIELGTAGSRPLYRCAGCTGAYLVPTERREAAPASGRKDRLSKDVMQGLLSLLHGLLEETAKSQTEPKR